MSTGFCFRCSPRFTTLYAWPYRFVLGMIPQMGVFMCLLMTPEARVVPPPTLLYHHSLHRLLDKSPGCGVFLGPPTVAVGGPLAKPRKCRSLGVPLFWDTSQYHICIQYIVYVYLHRI